MIFCFISREHILFIHPRIDGHLGCCHVLAIVYKVAVNMGTKNLKIDYQVIHKFHFWALWSNFYTVFCSGILHSHKQGMWVQFLYILTNTCYFGCMVAILMCVRWFGVAFCCCCCCLLLSCQSSLYILNTNPIKYIIHKYFLPFHRLPFHSVGCVLWCREHRFILQEDFMRFGEVGVEGRIQTTCNFYSAELGFPGGSDGKELACNAGDPGSIPGLGRSPGKGNGYPCQYSYLENAMDRGTWQAIVHRVTKESEMTEQLTLPLFFTLLCRVKQYKRISNRILLLTWRPR